MGLRGTQGDSGQGGVLLLVLGVQLHFNENPRLWHVLQIGESEISDVLGKASRRDLIIGECHKYVSGPESEREGGVHARGMIECDPRKDVESPAAVLHLEGFRLVVGRPRVINKSSWLSRGCCLFRIHRN